MRQIRITDLPQASPLTGSELTIVVQDGISKKTSINEVVNNASSEAKHWADVAESAASSSQSSASASTASAGQAQLSATQANTSASSAQSSAESAISSANSAATSANAASAQVVLAESASNAAQSSATSASVSASEAEIWSARAYDYADAASTSAAEAAASASGVEEYAIIATEQAALATQAKDQAVSSAASAASSASSASTSATQAASSATEANSAATAASSSATSASISESNAAGYASAAQTSANSSEASAATATTQAGLASASAADAANSASAASSSETAAAGSASTATTQAVLADTARSQAETAAANAASYASSASSSASSASLSASDADTAALDAAAWYKSFDERYLGPKSVAPTTDNYGQPLLTGALYWNTVTNTMMVWTGTAWTASSVLPGYYLVASDNLSDLTNVATARSNLGLGTSATLDAGAASGVATLGADGKIPSAQLPPLTITEVFVVNSQAAMLALTAQVGDVAVRTDSSQSFILSSEPASTLGNWTLLLSPPDAVTSVNGYVGSVSLTYSDVNAPSTTGTNATGTWNIGITGNAANVTGTVAIANGGTNGSAAPTAGAIAYGTGAAYGFTAAGTSGYFLKSAGAGVPVWSNSIGGYSVNGTSPYLDFADGSAVTLSAGRIWYNGSTGSWNLGMGGGNITQQVGEEFLRYGKASSAISGTILQLIYKTGVVGASGVITFAPAVAGITDPDQFVGVATEAIALNGFGRVTVIGVVNSVDTTGSAYGETWADNDDIWYNPVTGGLTKTKPSAPNIKFQVGTVINASAGSGSFSVRFGSSSSLGGTDSNVQFGALANANIIQYNSTLGYWTNTTIGSASGIQPYDADLTAIAALAGTSGLLKKTAADTWALDTNTYLTGNENITISGDATGSGATAISLTLASVGTAGTYTKVTTDAKGRVTSGSSPTTLAGYGITDAQPLDTELTAIAGLTPTANNVITGTGTTWAAKTASLGVLLNDGVTITQVTFSYA